MPDQPTSSETNSPLNLQYATFFVDELFFGIEVLKVQEVLRYQEMTSVPRAPGVIEGLINLRGEIVTAIDMRRRLGLRTRPDGKWPMNVVVHADDGAVSLLVDEIADVLQVNEKDYEPPPETLQGMARDLIRGAYKLDKRLLLILDTEKTIRVGGSDTPIPLGIDAD